MIQPGTADRLRRRERRVFPDREPTVPALRVHRAVSWIRRAERAGDADGRFLFLWVAFNAVYAEDHEDPGWSSERKDQRRFFRRIVACRGASAIHDAMRDEIPSAILRLIGNRYACNRFWKHRNGVAGFADWQSSFERANARIRAALRNQETRVLLGFLFGRLYVVRNQLLHGGATWAGRLNRTQVEDGAAILGRLTPIFVRLMMNHPNRDWGRPHYAPGPGAPVPLDPQ